MNSSKCDELIEGSNGNERLFMEVRYDWVHRR